MMLKVSIDKEKCKGCQYCVLYCPHKCIEMSKELNKHGVNYAVFVKKQACTQCGICQMVCPDTCVVVYKGIGDEVYKRVGDTISEWFEGSKHDKDNDEKAYEWE